ncbi:zinc finger protein 626-like, partial [Rhagoletis pomonella]|uniref:zinc finger protein 626-like n=1 Tax=Rhagoletis pomonella TaxID=28610 RepID=UPI0017874223
MANNFKMAMTPVQNDIWKLWCRLCAKEDARNINFFQETNGAAADTISNYSNIVDFIGRFFRIQIEEDHDPPHWLCKECFSLVSNLIYFADRVQRVQNMFKDIRNISYNQILNFREIREKYNLLGNELSMLKSLDARPTVENIFVTPEIRVQKTWDNVTNNEVISDEVKSGVLLDEGEGKSEFEDPIAELSESFCIDIEDHDSSNNTSGNKEVDKVETKINQQFSIKCGFKRHDKNLKTRLCKSEGKSMQHKYFCSDCSMHFHRIGNYKIHMRKKHEMVDELVPFTCPQCPRTFKTSSKLARHIKTHRPISEKRIFPCPQCDRKFVTKDYVFRHIQFVHEDIRPFICEECGEGTRTEATLRDHMLIHTDVAPFECEICKKAFKNQSRLKNHMDIHSSNKHVCTECGLQLNSRETLNRHMLVHSDVRGHKCDYCGRAFKRAKTLKTHLILHSGLKPYSCDFCDKTFATGPNCRTHKRKSHPEEFAATETSGEKTYTK